ncbi:uncharacterized protein BDV17DRAFT_291215 [Aspergillus undulatus]|uniref:uncharacterized protein n=1 Tax=Aspergillus undulatus TaxID=1810928 RepID=UPI003CCD0F6F
MPSATANSPREPIYTPENVPTIKNAKRLTATRTKQLIRAAARDITDPPPKPGLGECCGSSCDPCVDDLWREEVGAWRERWGLDLDSADGESGKGKEHDGGKGGTGNGVKEMKRRMPGTFEW